MDLNGLKRCVGVVGAAAATAWCVPWSSPVAEACGGTFCDAGPTAMPVEQTGETILFVTTDGQVEAHIQIQYDPETEAEEFAWVVPVTALPEFSVGSQRLFSNLLSGSVPTYGTNSWVEPCGGTFGGEGGDGWCDEGGADGGDDTGGPVTFDAGGKPPAPEVVLETTVGAFEVFVLDGGTAETVMQWLGDNGFTQDKAATPILEEYLAEGHLFVAFRLAHDAVASEIHPIVLRYDGDEPCVPIRLTRIAAQDDMEIRALFLGDDRWASSNYRHVNLNPLKFDWANTAANYRDVVAMAIDEPGADGHAFVTEYAGTTEIIDRTGINSESWDSMLFAAAATATEGAMQLAEQGLVDWNDEGECAGTHPVIESLIARYLPSPDGSLELLCSNPMMYGDMVDPMAWDPAGFAADFEERIVAPAVHAEDLLDTWPTLTRLYTMLSPHEMTADPMFHATPELPPVNNLSVLGTRNFFCDGNNSFNLPDGRLVAIGSSLWPDIYPDDMPWAETIEYLPAAGAPVVEVDNIKLIDGLLQMWNDKNGPVQSPDSPSCHDEGGNTSDTPPGGSDSPWPATGGTDGTAGADDEGGGAGGCGCTTNDRGTPWSSLLLLGLFALRRRRRQTVSNSLR